MINTNFFEADSEQEIAVIGDTTLPFVGVYQAETDEGAVLTLAQAIFVRGALDRWIELATD